MRLFSEYDRFRRLLKADRILCDTADRLRGLGLPDSALAVEACRHPIAEQIEPLQESVYTDFAARMRTLIRGR